MCVVRLRTVEHTVDPEITEHDFSHLTCVSTNCIVTFEEEIPDRRCRNNSEQKYSG